MSFTKKLTSVLLSLCMVLSVATVAIVPAAAETTAETYAQDTVQGGAILHCFDWSYNNIKANLADIAKAGYTAVQTSPVQSPKDYNASWTDGSDQWWKLYQPLGLSISDGKTWLGTKAELQSLCTEAEKYKIKVIVDIVANHLANNGASGGTYSNLNSGVDSDLNNSAYYHSDSNGTSDDSRYTITQRHLGMPDLNTGNSVIQQKVLDLLKECVDCGVDGFRFDAAKHIEVPTDDNSCKSNFWPTVIDGVKSYAADKDLYIYGEILGGAGTDISNYTKYIDVTDNYTGDRALDKAYFKAAGELADGTYYKGAAADESVLWVESHDTYMGNSGSAWVTNTSGVSADVIKKAWAVVGARADSTSLFFARPNSTMGLASTDTTWKSTEVAEVNKFKNHFEGTSEYLASSGSTAYVERGSKGVVISKLDGGGTVSLDAHQMADGTYTDQVTNNTFTVSGGKISGTVGNSGIAVVYNTEDSSFNFITASKLYLYPQNSSWSNNNPHFSMYLFNAQSGANTWVSMADTDGDGVYEAAVPDSNQWTNVIFCRMKNSATENNWDNKFLQTDDLYPSDNTDLFSVTSKSSSGNFSGTWSNHSDFVIPTDATEEPTTEADTDTYTIYVKNNAGWDKVNIHYWGGSNTSWPGVEMTKSGQYYTFNLPKDVTGLLFHNGSGSQTGDITSGIKDGATWVIDSNNIAKQYYLTGSISDWGTDDSYVFTANTSSEYNEEYVLKGVELTAGAELKVTDSSNGWYPGGTDNNYSVEKTGTYDIYFRPNKDGNDGWYEKYFYLADVSPCTVTWIDGDGIPLAVDTVAHGDVPEYTGDTPTKTGDAQYTYTFNGTWSPEITAATGDVEYIAQFDSAVNTYTVVWKDYDGTVLETDENVAYGVTPEFNGTTPVRQSTDSVNYVFAGWTPNVSTVTGNVTYIAQYTNSEKTYTITWVDEDGTVLETDEDVAAGSTPKYDGDTPTKAEDVQYTYTFSGWSPVVQVVSGNATYKAQYTQTVREYNITWKNYDGLEIKTDKVAYGEIPSYTGDNPVKPADRQNSYMFSGWSPELSEVTGDAEYTAQFASVLNKYTVTWKNYDGTVLDSEEVEFGKIPEYNKETPVRPSDLQYSYSFIGWQPGVDSVVDTIEYVACYSENPVPNITVKVINLVGWDDIYIHYWAESGDSTTWPGSPMVTDGDKLVYSAEIPFTVKGITFSNGAGDQVEDVTSGITDGAIWNIYRENYQSKIKSVPMYYLTGDMNNWEINSQYKLDPITNENGLEEYKISGVQLHENNQIKIVDTNGKYYPDGTNNHFVIEADGTYDVYFRPNRDGNSDWHYKYFYLVNVTTYTITWVDGDGNTLKTDTVKKGDTPAYNGDTPSKAADEQYTYTFKGWSPEITPATADATYTAVFDQSVNTYNVIWKNYDGTELATDLYEYGVMPLYKGETPTKVSSDIYDYTFAGWTPTVDTVTREITYTAVYDEAPHNYGEPVWNWTEDGVSATAYFKCANCYQEENVTDYNVKVDYGIDKTTRTATVNFKGTEYTNTIETEAKLFAGHSLTLNKNNDGDIGVNFFINVSEADVDRGVTVNFEWTVNGNTKHSSYILDKAKDFVTDHRYKASCFVAAAEMTYDIKATVTIGDELQEETNIYSVKRYADKILETSTDEKLINLIQAMLDYGTRAQIAFDRTQSGLANGGTYYQTYNVNASDISGVEDDMREKLSDYGLEYVGSTIVYLTKSTLRHYYKVSDADTFNNYKDSITMDGAAVSFSKNGEMIYCDVKNIGAYELDTVHTLKIGDTDYDYSVLTYLKKSIASDKTSDNTKELCKATYRYYVAAKAYFG